MESRMHNRVIPPFCSTHTWEQAKVADIGGDEEQDAIPCHMIHGHLEVWQGDRQRIDAKAQGYEPCMHSLVDMGHNDGQVWDEQVEQQEAWDKEPSYLLEWEEAEKQFWYGECLFAQSYKDTINDYIIEYYFQE